MNIKINLLLCALILTGTSTALFGAQRGRGGRGPARIERGVSRKPAVTTMVISATAAKNTVAQLLDRVRNENLEQANNALQKLKSLRITGLGRPQWLNDVVRTAEQALAERERGSFAGQAREQELEEAPEIIGEFQRVSEETGFQEEMRRAREEGAPILALRPERTSVESPRKPGAEEEFASRPAGLREGPAFWNLSGREGAERIAIQIDCAQATLELQKILTRLQEARADLAKTRAIEGQALAGRSKIEAEQAIAHLALVRQKIADAKGARLRAEERLAALRPALASVGPSGTLIREEVPFRVQEIDIFRKAKNNDRAAIGLLANIVQGAAQGDQGNLDAVHRIFMRAAQEDPASFQESTHVILLLRMFLNLWSQIGLSNDEYIGYIRDIIVRDTQNTSEENKNGVLGWLEIVLTRQYDAPLIDAVKNLALWLDKISQEEEWPPFPFREGGTQPRE